MRACYSVLAVLLLNGFLIPPARGAPENATDSTLPGAEYHIYENNEDRHRKDGGIVAAAYRPEPPSFSVRWKPVLTDATNTYFFVRVWNATGGDAIDAKPGNPVAWLAPVWTGR